MFPLQASRGMWFFSCALHSSTVKSWRGRKESNLFAHAALTLSSPLLSSAFRTLTWTKEDKSSGLMIYSTPLHHLEPHKARSLQIQPKCRMQPSIIYLPPLGGLGLDKMASLNPDGSLWAVMALVGRGSAALDSPLGCSEIGPHFSLAIVFLVTSHHKFMPPDKNKSPATFQHVAGSVYVLYSWAVSLKWTL